MQIRLTGKLTETSKDTRNASAKFEDKNLQSKKIQMHKKIFMTTFCQFFSLTLSIYWQKNNKIQSFNSSFSKTVCPIWLKFEKLSLVCFCLCNRPILISNITTSFCLYNHLTHQNLACFVLYLKIINIFLKNNICILY